MPANDLPQQPSASLADHIVAFGRVLRRAGVEVGSHQIMDAVRAVEVVGVRREDDVYQALFSVFVRRRDQVELFDQAFHLFWRAPSQVPDLMQMMLPQVDAPPPEQPRQRQRAQEALKEPGTKKTLPTPRRSEEEKTEVELIATYSSEAL